MQLPIEHDDALTLMAPLGLLAILDEYHPDARIVFGEEFAEVTAPGLDDAAIAAVVRRRAEAFIHSSPKWTKNVTDFPLDPRVSEIANRDWRKFYHDREIGIDLIPNVDRLARRFIGALGSPAYWTILRGGRNISVKQNLGDSDLEMTAAFKGMRLLAGKIWPMADAIRSRGDSQIVDGLEGRSIEDSLAREFPWRSRTALGLRGEGETDTALGWCAAWGMSIFPVRHATNVRLYQPVGSSTGAVYRPRDGGAVFAFPIIEREATAARYRALGRSAALVRVARHAAEASNSASGRERAEALHWLNAKGVVSVSLFQQRFSIAQVPVTTLAFRQEVYTEVAVDGLRSVVV